MAKQYKLEQPEGQQIEQVDSALACLLEVTRLMGLAADERQIRRAHIIGKAGMDLPILIRAAKELGLKAKYVDYGHKKRQVSFPLPVIAILQNGAYTVLLKRDGTNFVIFDPYKKQHVLVPEEKFSEQWSGKTVLVAKQIDSIDKKTEEFGLSWYLPVIMKYKSAFGKVLLFSVVIQLCGLLSPLFTQVIINKVLVHQSISTFNVLLAGMIVVGIFQIWLTGLRSYLFNHHISKVDATLSAKLFKHLLSLPIRFFENRKVGDIVSRIRELDTIRSFIVGTASTAILDCLFSLVYIGIMLVYSKYLTLIAVATLVMYFLLNLVVTPFFRIKLDEKFKMAADNQAFIIETLTGMQTVKSLAVEQQLIEKWDAKLARYIKTTFIAASINNAANTIANLIRQLSMICILWAGVYQVMDNSLTVGELIAFQMYMNLAISPIVRLAGLWQDFQQTRISINKIKDIVHETAEPYYNPDRTTLSAISGQIELDRVNFRYRQETREIIRQVSVKLAAGSRIGIVGPSGSGKSTLTKLIQRLYVPETGRILIDGIDIAQVEPAWLRRQIGVVLQESYLFNGTIQENIAIIKPEATMAQIVEAAQIAGAHEFINTMPQGYSTIVGERGATLSGGQKQRIAIARTLLTDPKILIFDEATSALDNETEKLIKNNLHKIAKGRTLIMIAHRLTTIRDCDQIIYIDEGKIIEQGTHAELLSQKGAYYNLYMQQAGWGN